MSPDPDDVGRSRRFLLSGVLNGVDVSSLVGGAQIARALYAAVLGIVLAYVLAPILVLVLVSVSSGQVHALLAGGITFEGYGRMLAPQWLESIAITVAYSLLSTVVAVFLGGTVAYAVDRFDFTFRRHLGGTTLWPLFVPQILLGFGLFLVLRQYDLLGNVLGLAAALSVFATPYASRCFFAALAGFDRRFEEAAYVLGADEIQTFVRITLPSLAPGVLAAAVFAFVVSFTNLQIAVFLGGPGVVPLPARVFVETQTDATPVVAAVATLDLLVALSATVAVERTFGVDEAFVR